MTGEAWKISGSEERGNQFTLPHAKRMIETLKIIHAFPGIERIFHI